SPAAPPHGETMTNDRPVGYRPPPPREGVDDVEWLLADARARAQAILDESMVQAEELIIERSQGVDPRAVSEIQHTVQDLAAGMTEVRRRLARIEWLLERGNVAPTPVEAGPPSPREAPYFEPPPPVSP